MRTRFFLTFFSASVFCEENDEVASDSRSVSWSSVAVPSAWEATDEAGEEGGGIRLWSWLAMLAWLAWLALTLALDLDLVLALPLFGNCWLLPCP